MESIIAAIYLDSNIDECKRFFFSKILKNQLLTNKSIKNPKSDLQEISLKYFKVIPNYKLINKTGPDHEPNFFVSVKINELFFEKSEGRNIQIAEQRAANKLLPKIKKFFKNEKN